MRVSSGASRESWWSFGGCEESVFSPLRRWSRGRNNVGCANWEATLPLCKCCGGLQRSIQGTVVGVEGVEARFFFIGELEVCCTHGHMVEANGPICASWEAM